MGIESRLEIMMGHIDPDHRLRQAEKDNTRLKVEKTAGQTLSQENTPTAPQTREVTPIPESMLSRLSNGFYRAAIYVRQLLTSDNLAKPQEANAHIKGNRTLDDAIISNDPTLVRELIQQGANVNQKDSQGFTPLHKASGKEKIMSLLISAGANLNAQNNQGYTPLHCCISSDRVACIKLLLSAGANVNLRNNQGYTPVDDAILCGNFTQKDTQIISELINAGADVHARGDDGRTLLHLAVGAPYLDPKIAQQLIAAGADVNAKDKYGSTPLHLSISRALQDGKFEIISILMDAGADVHARDRLGHTPIEKGNSLIGEFRWIENKQQVRSILQSFLSREWDE